MIIVISIIFCAAIFIALSLTTMLRYGWCLTESGDNTLLGVLNYLLGWLFIVSILCTVTLFFLRPELIAILFYIYAILAVLILCKLSPEDTLDYYNSKYVRWILFFPAYIHCYIRNALCRLQSKNYPDAALFYDFKHLSDKEKNKYILHLLGSLIMGLLLPLSIIYDAIYISVMRYFSENEHDFGFKLKKWANFEASIAMSAAKIKDYTFINNIIQKSNAILNSQDKKEIVTEYNLDINLKHRCAIKNADAVMRSFEYWLGLSNIIYAYSAKEYIPIKLIFLRDPDFAHRFMGSFINFILNNSYKYILVVKRAGGTFLYVSKGNANYRYDRFVKFVEQVNFDSKISAIPVRENYAERIEITNQDKNGCICVKNYNGRRIIADKQIYRTDSVAYYSIMFDALVDEVYYAYLRSEPVEGKVITSKRFKKNQKQAVESMSRAMSQLMYLNKATTEQLYKKRYKRPLDVSKDIIKLFALPKL